MAGKVVKMTPATKPMHSTPFQSTTKKRRVAAYARVSTDKEEQESSFDAQVSYYTRLIKSKADNAADSKEYDEDSDAESELSEGETAVEDMRETLIRFATENKTTIMGRTAGKMVSYLDKGKFTFTTGDIEKDFALGQKPRSLLATMLKDAHIVEMIGTKGRFFVYRFCGLGEDDVVPNMKSLPKAAHKPVKEKKAVKPVQKGAPLLKPDRDGAVAFPDADVLNETSTPEQKERVKNALLEYSGQNGNNVYTRTAARLGSYIDAGKYRFCSEDFTHDFGIDRKKRVMVATKLQRLGLIVPVGLDGRFYVYAFCTSPGQETDAPVLEEESVSTGFDNFEEEQELDLNGFFGRSPVPLVQKDHPMEQQSA